MAEVAVLEEEVVFLEEQVVNFRQGLYQEAVNVSSTKFAENSTDLNNQALATSFRQEQKGTRFQHDVNSGSSRVQNFPPLARSASRRRRFSSDTISDRIEYCSKSNSSLEDLQGKENLSCSNSTKDKQSPDTKAPTVKIPPTKPQLKPKSAEKCIDPMKLQVFCNWEFWCRNWGVFGNYISIQS